MLPRFPNRYENRGTPSGGRGDPGDLDLVEEIMAREENPSENVKEDNLIFHLAAWCIVLWLLTSRLWIILS